MLDDIQDDIVASIKRELEKLENKQKIRDTLFELSAYCFKPFQYFLYILIIIIVSILLMNAVNLYLLMKMRS
jgi:hypothetical protein